MSRVAFQDAERRVSENERRTAARLAEVEEHARVESKRREECSRLEASQMAEAKVSGGDSPILLRCGRLSVGLISGLVSV